MARWFWLAILLLAALTALGRVGALAGPAGDVLGMVVHTAWSLFVPLVLIGLVTAPGLFRDLTDPLRHFWRRFITRRREIEEIKRRIAQLDKPHHMVQLGTVYQQQGRTAEAAAWFQKALARDPELFDARYKLALCLFDGGTYQQAAEMLEAVHAEKPGHDYGMAYLRLAQAHHRLGNRDRATEVYQTLLRFYPGHPEGTYHFARLVFDGSDPDRARILMREVITTLRLAPGFQRRRNRHWMLKAHWWLWRH
jgi:tetratricopeptide (TPR) repeat protein